MPLGEPRDGEKPAKEDDPSHEGGEQQPLLDGEQKTADAESQAGEQDEQNLGTAETPKPERRDFIVEAEEEMQRKGPSPWHGLDLDDYDDWA